MKFKFNSLEGNMFSYIDAKLIACAQIFVHFVELQSDFTRRKMIALGMMCTGISFVALIPYVFIFLYGFLTVHGVMEKISQGAYFVSSVLFLMCSSILLVSIAHGVDQAIRSGSDLDVQFRIEDRQMLRKGLTLILFVTLFGTMLLAKKYGVATFSLYGGGAVTFSLFSVVCEYLICTTSLPPGEKERKQEKRNLRKLAPQGA